MSVNLRELSKLVLGIIAFVVVFGWIFNNQKLSGRIFSDGIMGLIMNIAQFIGNLYNVNIIN